MYDLIKKYLSEQTINEKEDVDVYEWEFVDESETKIKFSYTIKDDDGSGDVQFGTLSIWNAIIFLNDNKKDNT